MMGGNPNITTKGGACLVRLISYLNRSRPALRVGRLLGRQGLYQLSYSRKTVFILASNPLSVKGCLLYRKPGREQLGIIIVGRPVRALSRGMDALGLIAGYNHWLSKQVNFIEVVYQEEFKGLYKNICKPK